MSVVVALIDKQSALWKRDEAGSGYGRYGRVFGRRRKGPGYFVSATQKTHGCTLCSLPPSLALSASTSSSSSSSTRDTDRGQPLLFGIWYMGTCNKADPLRPSFIRFTAGGRNI